MDCFFDSGSTEVVGCGCKITVDEVAHTIVITYCPLHDSIAAEERINKLRKAIKSAMNELGVPQLGYAVPVANAYEILQSILEEVRD